MPSKKQEIYNKQWNHIINVNDIDVNELMTILTAKDIKKCRDTWEGKGKESKQFEPRLLCKMDTFRKIPQTFKDNNLMNALKITSMADSSTFQSSRIPGVYIFHKFFNPFTENALQFRLSVFLFSFLRILLL